MKLGIYIRVSSDFQATNGISLDNQIRRGLSCRDTFGYDTHEIYNDAGVSGAARIEEKKALCKLIEDVNSNKIDAIFFTDLDRLVRDKAQTELIKIIVKERNIKLFSSNGEINLKDVTQELLFDITSLLAIFEIRKTSNRIKSVLQQNARKGKCGGGSLLNYGFTKDKDKMLVIEPNEAIIIKKIYFMALNGYGTRTIAAELNILNIPTKRGNVKKGFSMKVRDVNQTVFIWRDSVIYRYLTNSIYYGKRNYKGEQFDVPAIVSKDIFDKVQIQLKLRNGRKDTTNKYQYLLKGIINCSCGSPMYGKKRFDNHDNFYMCLSKRYFKKDEKDCETRSINIDKIEKYVINAIFQLPKMLKNHFKNNDDLKQENDEYLEILERKNIAKERLNIFVEQVLIGVFPNDFYDEKLKELNIEYDLANELVKKKEKVIRTLNQRTEIILSLAELVKKLKDFSDFNDKRNLVLGIVKQVVVSWNYNELKHSIKIIYNINSMMQYLVQSKLILSYNKFGGRLSDENIENTLEVTVIDGAKESIKVVF